KNCDDFIQPHPATLRHTLECLPAAILLDAMLARDWYSHRRRKALAVPQFSLVARPQNRHLATEPLNNGIYGSTPILFCHGFLKSAWYRSRALSRSSSDRPNKCAARTLSSATTSAIPTSRQRLPAAACTRTDTRDIPLGMRRSCVDGHAF